MLELLDDCKTITTEVDEDMRISINSELKYPKKSDHELVVSHN